MTKEFYTASPLETEALGKRLCEALMQKGAQQAFVAMFGEMGVGKTAFARGFGSALGITGVKSPTYTVVSEHRALIPLFHFDMYRIEDEDELYSIGFYDYLDRGICVVEWSENIPYALPDSYLKIEISKTTPDRPDERKLSAVKI